jgi:membrane protease subunit HflC
MRSILGSSTFLDVVRIKREALMRAITERVDVEAKSLGIEVVDVRLKRADLPEANSQAIYERMKTERQREAAEIRAQGVEASKRIKATADRQVTVTLAEANRDSERTRGEGDAERNRIYAEAFGKDQDFFAFYRSMQAYEEGLKSNDTRLVISPSSEFFQYFNDPRGAPRPPEQKAPGRPGSAPSPTSSQAAR